MKKLLFLSLLLLFATLSSQAQLRGGIKGGLNACDFIISNVDNEFAKDSYQSKLSYHFGSFINYSFSDQIGLEFELLFSNKGYKLKLENNISNISLNYLNWPVLIFYRPIPLLEIEFGPEFGFLISGEDLVKSFDMGFDIGLRFNVLKTFNAGVRYSQGIPFKMNLEELGISAIQPKYANGVFQVYLGFNLINETSTAESK
jgi:hypothetical protein